MDHIALLLDLTAHTHYRGAQHHAPMLLEEIGPDDEIGDIGLILKRDEHGALGGAWLLPQENEAGEIDPSPVANILERGAGNPR